MKLMCCHYNKLNGAKNLGQSEVRKGQTVQGGEQLNSKGRQQSFEYIANIQRLFDRNGYFFNRRIIPFENCVQPLRT